MVSQIMVFSWGVVLAASVYFPVFAVLGFFKGAEKRWGWSAYWTITVACFLALFLLPVLEGGLPEKFYVMGEGVSTEKIGPFYIGVSFFAVVFAITQIRLRRFLT